MKTSAISLALAALLSVSSASAEVVPYPDTPEALLQKGGQFDPAIQQVVPQETLPGEKIPYILRADKGEHYIVGGKNINFISRSVDSGNMFEMLTITGGKGSGEPLHSHRNNHVALYLMQGTAELWLDGKHYAMQKGDFASIPPNTEYAFKFNAHRTKLLEWYSGPGILPVYQALGEPSELNIQPDQPDLTVAPAKRNQAEKAGDIHYADVEYPQTKIIPLTNPTVPSEVVPYVIAADEGIKFAGGPEFFSLLATQETTGGKFFVVMTQGPETEMVPRHYHKMHTENFFCLEGQVDMIVNDSNATIYPGDFAHVPTGTIHSYSMARGFNRFMGFLTPGLFQKFFETLGESGYEGNVYPAEAHKLRFDRVLKELDSLDLVIVDKPQQAH